MPHLFSRISRLATVLLFFEHVGFMFSFFDVLGLFRFSGRAFLLFTMVPVLAGWPLWCFGVPRGISHKSTRKLTSFSLCESKSLCPPWRDARRTPRAPARTTATAASSLATPRAPSHTTSRVAVRASLPPSNCPTKRTSTHPVRSALAGDGGAEPGEHLLDAVARRRCVVRVDDCTAQRV